MIHKPAEHEDEQPSPEALAFAQDWAQPSRRMLMARALDTFARQAVEKERERCEEIAARAWEQLACPNHYSGQVARNACHIAAERIHNGEEPW